MQKGGEYRREYDAGGWMDGWMKGVLGHFYALSRLNWSG